MMYVTGWNLNSLKDSQSPIYKISLVLVKPLKSSAFLIGVLKTYGFVSN